MLNFWVRKLALSLLVLIVPSKIVFSEELSLQELLAGYIANHREIQTMMVQLEQRQLSSQSTEISQGVKVSLSTGTISIGSSQVRAEPSASIKLPKLNATFVEARVPLQLMNRDASQNQQSQAGASGNSGMAVEGTSISIGTEILGGSGKTARLTLLKSQRSLLEAQRAVQNQALAVEKEFYTKIKELYSGYASLLSTRSTVYDKELDLRSLQIQGYRTSSPRYRTAQMEVLSAQRNVDKQQRNLQRELELFSQKCGLAESEGGSLTMETIPPVEKVLAATGILERLPLEPVERYSPMESAQWSLATTQMELDADSAVTLTAEAGYTYRNKSLSSSSQPDTVDAALSLQALGGKLTSGISVPIGGEKRMPTAQLSLTWSPDDMRTRNLQRQQNQLNLELAQLKITSVEEDYQEAMENARLTWQDLLWNRSVVQEELNLYQQLAQDTTTMYQDGLTSDTEYQQALTNRDRARIQCQIADLELILHAISTRQLFLQEVD